MGLNRRKWIAAKIEASAGVPESLTAAEAKILAYDPVIEADIEMEDRRPSGLTMGELGATPGQYLGTARIRVECKGSGTSPTLPHWAASLLLACGMKNTSGLLTLVSSLSDQKTVTIALWEDGRRKRLYGAMGNATITGQAGKAVYIEFEFKGIFDAVIDASAPSNITHETTKPIRLAAATLDLDGWNPRISQLSLNFGNDVQIRDHIYTDGATRASGASHAYIADRSPRLTLDPESTLVATHDLYGKALSPDDTDDLELVMAGGAGNTITLAAPSIAYRPPTTGNRNGMSTDQVEISFPTTAGDTEFSISFIDPE